MTRPLAYLPSPTQSVWHLGPLPIHAYALCIVAGILVALRVADNRWRAVGGRDGDMWDVSGWAIVFGIIGGRLYHVVSDPELYFKRGEHPLNALKIWDSGLGIWGAVALGGLGAWIGCRRKSIRLSVFADVVIPGVVAAQGLGRWGKWFNNVNWAVGDGGRACGAPDCAHERAVRCRRRRSCAVATDREPPLSFIAFIVASAARAVAAHPQAYAYRDWRGRLVQHHYVDVQV